MSNGYCLIDFMNINNLKDDGFIESVQENEEGQMAIPSTINDGDFQGTTNLVVTHPRNTNDTGYDSLN